MIRLILRGNDLPAEINLEQLTKEIGTRNVQYIREGERKVSINGEDTRVYTMERQLVIDLEDKDEEIQVRQKVLMHVPSKTEKEQSEENVKKHKVSELKKLLSDYLDEVTDKFSELVDDLQDHPKLLDIQSRIANLEKSTQWNNLDDRLKKLEDRIKLSEMIARLEALENK